MFKKQCTPQAYTSLILSHVYTNGLTLRDASGLVFSEYYIDPPTIPTLCRVKVIEVSK